MEKFDTIIAGGGIAGLSAALESSKQGKNTVLIFRSIESSNSYYAQGGIAAAIGEKDSWKQHYKDTLIAGAGMCNEKITMFITKKAKEAITELMGFGLEFDGDEKPELGLEGGHSRERILHIKGDQTGKEITKFLHNRVNEEGINIINSEVEGIFQENCNYSGLIDTDENEYYSGELILATGGYSGIFAKTTNPETTVGKGIGIAKKSGCELSGMEFVQFHPTTLLNGDNFLVSEAVRGEGGKIVNENQKEIVNPLYTRDKVSRAIYSEIVKGKKVFLDAREITENFSQRFPSVFNELKKNKIDPYKELIPIESAAHYSIGGIKTNNEGKTNILGLLACGECSNSGFHGANRLASNSLLEALIMGKKCGQQKKKTPLFKRTKINLSKNRTNDELKKIMWEKCGIIREKQKLEDALTELKKLGFENNSVLIGKEVVEAALLRKESIGVHYRVN